MENFSCRGNFCRISLTMKIHQVQRCWKIIKICDSGNLQKSQSSPILGETVNRPIPIIFRFLVRFICLLIRKNTFIRISHRNHIFFLENDSKFSKNLENHRFSRYLCYSPLGFSGGSSALNPRCHTRQFTILPPLSSFATIRTDPLVEAAAHSIPVAMPASLQYCRLCLLLLQLERILQWRQQRAQSP